MPRKSRLTRSTLKIIEQALAEGMSKSQIADLVGVHYTAVWQWWKQAMESDESSKKILRDLKVIIDAAEQKEVETAIKRIAAFGLKKREKLVRRVRIHEEAKGYEDDGSPIFQITARVTSDETTDTDADWKAIESAIKLKYPHLFNTKQLEHSGEIDGVGSLKVVFEDIDTSEQTNQQEKEEEDGADEE